MTTLERLASLIEQAFDGDSKPDTGWHGPSVSGLLRDVTVRQALARVTPGAHTIWELVLHMSFWDDVCVRRLKGERLSVTTGSPGDWPEQVGSSADDWSATVESSRRSRQSLVLAVRGLADDDLGRIVPDWGWTYEKMIHGTLHHDLYHAGQIALIRTGFERSAS
jgi:hypothetical protein